MLTEKQQERLERALSVAEDARKLAEEMVEALQTAECAEDPSDVGVGLANAEDCAAKIQKLIKSGFKVLAGIPDSEET